MPRHKNKRQMTKTIQDVQFAVYGERGHEPIIVDNTEKALRLVALLDECDVIEVTDATEFSVANACLDFSEVVPARKIYRIERDGIDVGNVVFAEDYAD